MDRNRVSILSLAHLQGCKISRKFRAESCLCSLLSRPCRDLHAHACRRLRCITVYKLPDHWDLQWQCFWEKIMKQLTLWIWTDREPSYGRGNPPWFITTKPTSRSHPWMIKHNTRCTRKSLTRIWMGKSSCRSSSQIQYRWFHQRVSCPSNNDMGLSEDWAIPKSVSVNFALANCQENPLKVSNPKRHAHAESLARWPNVVSE